MIKVLLLVILMDASTGEIKGVATPLPAFETVEQCKEATKQLPAAPPGHKIRAYCVDPRLTFV